ncbi:MAG: hypothetical protein GVY35_04855 [Bacteroidetes bacterium]|jgi:hypothetical protein|nr:hypothetical protein [Bacteroidota bacterium]
MKLALALCLAACVAFSTAAADETPELELKPCAIELVDGTTVKGRLAAQFEMDKHLIVYSPRLATVRSFLKDHVHTLTVDGKREQLNAKRALTDDEKALVGQTAWPDEPPTKGPKPAYTTEKWQKPERLLVWAKPGKSGTYLEPGNWLANGQVLSEMKTKETGLERDFNRGPATGGRQTDILFPACASKYQVRGVAHHQRQSFMARHITVESNASFQHNLSGGFGNFWVTPTGSFNGGGNAIFRGAKHTFLLNGLPRTSLKPISDVKQIEAKNLARKWCLRKDDPAASMEIIGGAGSGDETHVIRGHMILSDNSALLFGARCIFHVYEGAILQLQSGSVFSMIGECTYRPDMRILGTLQAGSPGRPIDRDVFVGLGFKDRADAMQHKYHGNAIKYALIVQKDAQLRVFSKDPSKARLVFAHHGLPGDGEEGMPRKDKQPEKYSIYMGLPRLIGAVFLNDPQLDGVVFDDFHKGGILLGNPSVRSKWKNVVFGPGNEGKPEELIGKADPVKFAHQGRNDR